MQDEVKDIENTDDTENSLNVSVNETEADLENTQSIDNAEDSNNVTEPKRNKRRIKREPYAETYALAAEVESLRERNATMEQLLHESLSAGAYHYGTVAQGLLDKAKGNLAKALGEGNVDAVATATAEIAHATSVVNDTKRIPSVASSNNNGVLQEPPQIAPNIYANENMLYDWLEDNPDLDKSSAEYNENLTKQVLPFINKLENRLKRNNQMHLIASPEYFNIIDEYVDKLKDSKETSGKHFGGVRSRYQSTNVKDNKPMVLTPQQKKAAAAFHMSEEKYINYLQKYAKEARG